MIRLVLAFLCLFALPLAAAPVKVTSGEHEGFTRLVFNFGTLVDWQVGRSLDGYDLRLTSPSPTYDLQQAFATIGKSRLAAIWADPVSGDLHVGLACACHAMPFEFRPGIVVIDLKDGPPPKGSSFELALDGSTATPIAARKSTRPRARPDSPSPNSASTTYDWTTDVLAQAPSTTTPATATATATATEILPPDPGLQPLRDSLLQQMARGAAQGTIGMAAAPPSRKSLPDSTFPMAQIRIGDQPGDLLKPDSSVKGDLTAQGAQCAPDTALNIFEWGDPAVPVSEQIASAMADLTGEFDRPDPQAVARAIRFDLFIGFGAEARQLITAFAPQNPDIALWTALSFHLDETPDPAHFFIGQTACDGPAALWAMLASPDLVKGDSVNSNAVRLAFSALPIHLRRQLGPRLANQFLTLGDADSARALTDSIQRAPGDPGAEVVLLESSLNLQSGAPEKAEVHIAKVLADPGPSQPEALIALINTRVSQTLPVTPDTALELQALLSEYRGSDIEPALLHATILARAASGDFAGAFYQLDQDPTAAPKVWALLAPLGSDDDLLRFAVLPADAAPPMVPPGIAERIATRLIDVGLANSAQRWLDVERNANPLLVARAAIGRADGRAAMAALVEQTNEQAAALRDRALALTGQDQERARLLEDLGQTDAAAAALARAGDWTALSQRGSGLWQALAVRLQQTPPLVANSDTGPTSTGPLAQAAALATAGGETRTAVNALLAALPQPKKAAP